MRSATLFATQASRQHQTALDGLRGRARLKPLKTLASYTQELKYRSQNHRACSLTPVAKHCGQPCRSAITGMRLLRAMKKDTEATMVHNYLGWEQEFFVVDAALFKTKMA